ncbi:MAG: flagellar basal body L-ring protein FlgH, partial [Pseudomonadota bacterium]
MRYALPLAALVLAGCAQVRELAAPPQLTAVRAELVDEIPPPEVPPRIAGAPATVHASTWRPAKANLFADAVALSPGDVLTVLIAIDDNAKLDNRSDRERSV